MFINLTTNRNLVFSGVLACAIVAGCSVQSKHEEGKEHDQNVKISTPFGGMKVQTDDVDAKDAGLTVFPGATLKAKEDGDHDEKKANVNIDTPWFGLKVVALTYESKESQDKV